MITKNWIYHYTLYLCDRHAPFFFDLDDDRECMNDLCHELNEFEDYIMHLQPHNIKFFFGALEDFDEDFSCYYCNDVYKIMCDNCPYPDKCAYTRCGESDDVKSSRMDYSSDDSIDSCTYCIDCPDYPCCSDCCDI